MTLIDIGRVYHFGTDSAPICYSLRVDDPLADIQAQRDLEDEALRLGAERDALEGKLGKNLEQIVDLLAQAPEHGVSVERFATLIGVRRQQLYRWRDAIALLRREAQEQD